VAASLFCAAPTPPCNRFVWLINPPAVPRRHVEGVLRCWRNFGSGAGASELWREPFWAPASRRRLAIPAAIITTGASSAMSKRTLADTIPTSYGTRYVFVVQHRKRFMGPLLSANSRKHTGLESKGRASIV
jgi:hypothetical protein